MSRSEPRPVFYDRAQEECLVGIDFYGGGEDGTVEVLICRGIKVIQPAFTLPEEYLPVLDADSEEILRGVKGHRVVLSCDG